MGQKAGGRTDPVRQKGHFIPVDNILAWANLDTRKTPHANVK